MKTYFCKYDVLKLFLKMKKDIKKKWSSHFFLCIEEKYWLSFSWVELVIIHDNVYWTNENCIVFNGIVTKQLIATILIQ